MDGLDDKKEILMKSKALVNSSYDLEIKGFENKLYYYCLFMAQKQNNGVRTCTVKLSDLQKLISNNNIKPVRYIEEILDKFTKTNFKFHSDRKITIGDSKRKLKKGSASLLSVWECTEDGQYYVLTFADQVYNYIVNYYKEDGCPYAPIDLEIINKYKSTYSHKLYDLLRLWSRENEVVYVEFNVNYLRVILGAETKYLEYKNFKQRVLNQAIKEINNMGNMEVSITKNKNSDNVRFKILDKETKTYFKNKNMTKEQTIEEMNKYVNLPRGVFTRDAATHLIRYCFEESIFFTDNVMNKLLLESIELIKSSKKIDLISMKDGSYAELLSDFKKRFDNYIDNVVIP